MLLFLSIQVKPIALFYRLPPCFSRPRSYYPYWASCMPWSALKTIGEHIEPKKPYKPYFKMLSIYTMMTQTH